VIHDPAGPDPLRVLTGDINPDSTQHRPSFERGGEGGAEERRVPPTK